ncbi:NepR family anti-sigma factor [Acidimangrovimonas sediminis]|uniref:NepR family anti-sigma factor n=1 Tax=Acidimangrovimonas sediminis TaxID=2056283 RepID=UPI0013047F07|nr:NepR family anti-sigma factor [Acidimangrovimonas sediminis]
MSKNTASDGERANLRRQIDENLRRVYERELEREVPDRFRDLLNELSGKMPAGKESAK